jgi:uncharacterized membrane protein YeaQ/YmgE (transglycosylase-associated protein family)
MAAWKSTVRYGHGCARLLTMLFHPTLRIAGGVVPRLIGKERQMTILQFIVLAIIAAIAGGLGQALAGYSLGGCLVSAIVGWIGAFIGMWIARQFGLPTIFAVNVGGEPFPVVWSIIGSAILAAIVGLLTRPARTV